MSDSSSHPASEYPPAHPFSTDHDLGADVIAFVALSRLPISLWREVGARLRAGDPPALVLERLIAERRTLAREGLKQRRVQARAALSRGLARGLTPIFW